MVKTTNYASKSIKSLVNMVVTADRKVSEGMFVIGKCGISATDKSRADRVSKGEFAKMAGISQSVLSRAMGAVKFYEENNLTGKFEYGKLYVMSQKPELFTKAVDSEKIERIIQSDAEKVLRGDMALVGFDKKTGAPVYKDLTKPKDKDKSKSKSEDKSKDKGTTVTVTDANGIKYNVPADILAKYKVTE